jgi:hypothetical protein
VYYTVRILITAGGRGPRGIGGHPPPTGSAYPLIRPPSLSVKVLV